MFAALALIAHGELRARLVLALGLVDGTLALTGRGLTRGAVAAVLQPADLLREGNALMNIGFAVASVGGAALGRRAHRELGLSTALFVDAASFLVIAVLLAATRGLPAVDGRRASRSASASAAGLAVRAHETRSCGCCWSARPSRSSSSRWSSRSR